MLKALIVEAGRRYVLPKAKEAAQEAVFKALPKLPRKEPRMNPAVLGAVRHILQLVAGSLVAKGVIDAAGVELVIGAGTSVITFGWYLIEQRLKRV
jgi:hypothetical protein